MDYINPFALDNQTKKKAQLGIGYGRDMYAFFWLLADCVDLLGWVHAY